MSALYIKTSKINIFLNLIISIFVAIISGAYLYSQIAYDGIGKTIGTLVIAWLLFIHLFRVIEYLMTKNSILVVGITWFGVIKSGSKARSYFILNLSLFIIIELLIIYINKI